MKINLFRTLYKTQTGGFVRWKAWTIQHSPRWVDGYGVPRRFINAPGVRPAFFASGKNPAQAVKRLHRCINAFPRKDWRVGHVGTRPL